MNVKMYINISFTIDHKKKNINYKLSESKYGEIN